MFDYPPVQGAYPSAVPYYAPRSYAPAQFQMPPASRFPAAELIKVNGRAGAEAFRLDAPNSRVALFDANSDVFYIKTTDGAGYPSIEAYSFTPAQQEAAPSTAEFISREEFDSFKNNLMEELKNVQQSVLKVKPSAAAGK